MVPGVQNSYKTRTTYSWEWKNDDDKIDQVNKNWNIRGRKATEETYDTVQINKLWKQQVY